jgi:uncharacterized membrane protein YfcA
MELYLPIAELSVNWAVILAIGAAVGFLSGMFGVGGGFLMTPLLMFYGIPPGIAVATQASQMTATSLSGALAQWRLRQVDAKMGAVLLAGGLLGALAGVWVFAWLKSLGQIELAVSALYIVLLGSIGVLMLRESLSAMRAETFSSSAAVGQKASSSSEAVGQKRFRNWIHALPFKMRFRRSKLYISAIPPLLLGAAIGLLAAVMGVGGGFLAVPAMIYVLRMPTSVVIGTSQFQILFVGIVTTILQAVTNHAVDIALAFLLIVGGVAGVQAGVRAASRFGAAQLRALLAVLVVAVALGLLYGLVVTPRELYSIVALTP